MIKPFRYKYLRRRMPGRIALKPRITGNRLHQCLYVHDLHVFISYSVFGFSEFAVVCKLTA